LGAAGVAGAAPPAAVCRLAADGASEELAAALIEATRCLQDSSTEEASDRARSAAERFLFERLESLPETAGQFRLNAPLGFRFGTKEAEGDLCAPGLHLVLEIDGYFHFRDAEGYRRDRRKDWELQRRGFRVLRFLAQDVVTYMEEMLDTILEAVEHCRRHPQPGRMTEP
jgi:very-short-patch-repair endonuclease